MVRKDDHVDVGREEAFVACGARVRLETFAAAALELQPMRRERQVTQCALLGAELGPAARIGRKPVIDVDGGECERMRCGEGSRGIEQHHRVDAARQRDSDARVRGYMLGKRRGQRRVNGGDGGISPR